MTSLGLSMKWCGRGVEIAERQREYSGTRQLRQGGFEVEGGFEIVRRCARMGYGKAGVLRLASGHL